MPLLAPSWRSACKYPRQPAEPCGAIRRRRGLLFVCRRGCSQLGQRLLHLAAQCFRLKGAGAQIGRDGHSSFGGALPELRALSLAHANGDAGRFEIAAARCGRLRLACGGWKQSACGGRDALGDTGRGRIRQRLGRRLVARVRLERAFVTQSGYVVGECIVVPGTNTR